MFTYSLDWRQDMFVPGLDHVRGNPDSVKPIIFHQLLSILNHTQPLICEDLNPWPLLNYENIVYSSQCLKYIKNVYYEVSLVTNDSLSLPLVSPTSKKDAIASEITSNAFFSDLDKGFLDSRNLVMTWKRQRKKTIRKNSKHYTLGTLVTLLTLNREWKKNQRLHVQDLQISRIVKHSDQQ